MADKFRSFALFVAMRPLLSCDKLCVFPKKYYLYTAKKSQYVIGAV